MPPPGHFPSSTPTLAQLREALQRAPHLLALVDASPLPFDPTYRSPCWRPPGDAPPLLCLPSLYLAGMPKCSTSSLFVSISHSHPLIAPNCDGFQHKEPQWWTRNAENRTLAAYLTRAFGTRCGAASDSPLGRVAAAPGTLFLDGSVQLLWEPKLHGAAVLGPLSSARPRAPSRRWQVQAFCLCA